MKEKILVMSLSRDAILEILREKITVNSLVAQMAKDRPFHEVFITIGSDDDHDITADVYLEEVDEDDDEGAHQ